MSRAPASSSSAEGPPDWEALGRFLSGDSPPAEADAIAAWLAAHPDDERLLHALDAATAPLARASAPIDTEAALAKVLARRDAATAHDATSSLDARRLRRDRAVAIPARRSWSRQGAAIAATLAVMVAGGLWWQSRTDTPARADVLIERHATAAGAIDSLRLADGTEVVLGPGSTLTPSATYGSTDREITLDGEAYFVVTRDDARPFTVRTSDARVVDLGTAFTVQTNAAHGVSVVVTSGRVRVSAAHTNDGALDLAAGEAATFWRADSTVRRDSADVDRAMAFTQGRLVLRDAPVESLVDAVRRWYGLTLTVDPTLRGRRVTATFERETRAVVLETLALSLAARIEQRGDSVTFRPIDTP
jgi:transmembrane sensor